MNFSPGKYRLSHDSSATARNFKKSSKHCFKFHIHRGQDTHWLLAGAGSGPDTRNVSKAALAQNKDQSRQKYLSQGIARQSCWLSDLQCNDMSIWFLLCMSLEPIFGPEFFCTLVFLLFQWHFSQHYLTMSDAPQPWSFTPCWWPITFHA